MEAGADLVAGAERQHALGRHLARRPVPFGGRRANWQLVEPLWKRAERLEWFGGGYDVPGTHSICAHSARPGELLVGISCGGAWITRDGGASWEVQARGMRADFLPPERAYDPNIQDPHCIVRCPARPEVLWCQHHNGIFRSTDAAASWHAIEGAPLSSFGFAVAVHPADADTAWFVPGIADQTRVPVGAALAVNRTRDGDKSFETFRDGGRSSIATSSSTATAWPSAPTAARC